MSHQPKTFALGLGLTNECNLTCSFCYRDPNRVDRLTLDQVQQVMNWEESQGACHSHPCRD